MSDSELTTAVRSWKQKEPDKFLEAVGEYNQGSEYEAYWLIKNGIDHAVPVDDYPRASLINELLRQYKEETN